MKKREYKNNSDEPKAKNRVFCLDAQKSKLVFETEKKAETFLKFNKDKIYESSGYAPVRAYYCPSCCAWHVTHRKDYRPSITSTERVVNTYNEYKEKVKEMRAEWRIKNDDAVKALDTLKETLYAIILRGYTPTSAETTAMKNIYRDNVDLCKAKKLKKQIRAYFTQLNIDIE